MEGLSSRGLENERNTVKARRELREKGLKFLFNVYTDYNLYDFNHNVDLGDVAVATAQGRHNSRMIELASDRYGDEAVTVGDSYPPGLPHTEGVYVTAEAYIEAHEPLLELATRPR